MRLILCVFAFVATGLHGAFASQALFTDQPSMMPKLALVGDHKVGVTTLEVTRENALNLTDFTSMQNRQLTLEVWYPAATETKLATYENVTREKKAFSLQGQAFRDASPQAKGEFPLVVLSHGYTGYRTIMFYLGEHLASHGYVVVGIDHTDSTNEDVDFVNNPGGGFVSTLINRSRDQQFVLEHFSQKESAIAKITDANRAAIVGYSMGGFGAINTIGGCYEFTAAGLQRLGFPEQAATAMLPLFNFCNAGREKADERWQAMISFAPWGQEINVHAPAALANIQVPSLYVAGENDDISGYEHGVKKIFDQTTGKNTFMLVYENARHNFAPHPAPVEAYETDLALGHYIEPAWDNEILTRINEHMSLAFLNCFLKNQQSSCAYLPERLNATQEKQADGKLTPAWPGFPERWATGMRFYRKDL